PLFGGWAIAQTIDLATANGTTVAFNPASGDILQFDASFTASGLNFVQQGADVVVTCGNDTVTLATVTIDQLLDASFSFLNGSVARFDAGPGSSTLNGTALGD